MVFSFRDGEKEREKRGKAVGCCASGNREAILDGLSSCRGERRKKGKRKEKKGEGTALFFALGLFRGQGGKRGKRGGKKKFLLCWPPFLRRPCSRLFCPLVAERKRKEKGGCSGGIFCGPLR